MNKFCIVVLLIACSIPANPQFSLEVNAGVERVSAHLKIFKFIYFSLRNDIIIIFNLIIIFGKRRIMYL